MKAFHYRDQLQQLKRNVESQLLFDPVRKSWIRETPEEIIRQCLIIWLQLNHQIPISRMAVEKQIKVFGLKKRFDLVIYDKSLHPYILIECKSDQMPASQAMFDQAAIYNYHLKAPYLGICNGVELRISKIDFETHSYSFINHLPDYPF